MRIPLYPLHINPAKIVIKLYFSATPEIIGFARAHNRGKFLDTPKKKRAGLSDAS